MTDQPDLTDAIQELKAEVERLNNHRFVQLHGSPKKLLMFQLARGMAFGLGTVLGATILVSVVGWWVAQLEFVPVLGEWLASIVEEMNKGR